MVKKPTSKRPSVAGHKVKVSNEPAVAAPASPAEAGGPAGSSFGAEASSIQHEEVSGKTGTPRMSKKAGKRRVSRRAVAIVSAVLVALAVATSLLAWNQWLRYDDAADIQGTWRVEGSTATFIITDSQIQLTEEVSYPYTLDTFAKTISFSFGNYEGGGSYVFSPERDVLTITETAPDADGGTAATTLVKQ